MKVINSEPHIIFKAKEEKYLLRRVTIKKLDNKLATKAGKLYHC